MYDIESLKQKRGALMARMQSMLDRIESENRGFSKKEDDQYQEWEDDLKDLNSKIQRAKDYDPSSFRKANSGLDDGEFRNFGEFLHVLRTNPGDGRLQELRAQQAKDGTSGGFGVPAQFSNQFLSVPAAPSVIRPRATVLPAGSPPDSEISIPALDQRASQGASHMFGGVQVYHTGEGDQLTESNMRLRQIKLEPKSMTAYVTASNKLLANWDSASVIIPQLMRNAKDAAEDTDFLSGNGVNKALGVLNSPAAIDISRATASQIGWADIRSMLSRLRVVGGSPAWVASQTTMGQLIQISDASSRAIWQPNAAAGLPPSLYGFPVFFHDRSPALGSKGDLVLADFRGFLIKDGSGPNIAVSEHFRFLNDETCFRLTWNVDGQPWLNEPLALEGSTANTVSPFIILDTP